MSPSERSPSLPTLLTLGCGVVLAHLSLLLGAAGLGAASRGEIKAPHAPVLTERHTPAEPAARPVQAVTITQVGWSVPAPEAATARRAPVPSKPAVPTATRPAAEAVSSGSSAQLSDQAQSAEPPLPQAHGEQVVQATSAAAARPVPPGPQASPLPVSTPPPSTRLNYDVVGQAKGFEYRASGVLDWRLEPGGAYEARMELSMLLLGSRVQTSRGTVGPDGLRPVRFGDRRRNSERAAHFEAQEGRIRFSNNAPQAPLLPGAQDRLSLFLQLAGLMRGQPRSEGEAIEFQVAGVGDAEAWRFDVGATETLNLPAGAVKAVHLRRAARKPHDTTVDVWLAPDLGYLPVRLRVAQANGDVADQQLARLP